MHTSSRTIVDPASVDSLISLAEAADLLGGTPWEAYCLTLNDELGTPLRAVDGTGPIVVQRTEVDALLAGRAELDALTSAGS